MTARAQTEGAKIYEFPLKGRDGLGRKPSSGKPKADLQPASYAVCSFGDGWYHDAAIHEADALPRPPR